MSAGEIKKLKFSDGETVDAPNLNADTVTQYINYASEAAFVAAKGSAAATGDVFYDTTEDVVRYYDGSWLIQQHHPINSTSSYAIPSGQCAIYVEKDIQSGHTITVTGAIAVLGEITGDGTLTGTGTVYGK